MGDKEQSSSVSPQDKVAPRGAIFCTRGGTNCLYDLNNRQEHEHSLDVVTGMIHVFYFIIYALLDLEASLCFVTPYCHELLHYS